MAEFKRENKFINPLRNTQFDLTHDNPNCEPTPSLLHSDLAVAAITLWEKADIPSFTLEFLSNDSSDSTSEIIYKGHYQIWWPEVVMKVKSNVSQMSLSKDLENKLLEIVKKVGDEILTFLESLQRAKRGLTFNKNLYLQYVQWTSYGTIDYIKSISSLVMSSSLSALENISLSCYFCLENFVNDLPTLMWINSSDINHFQFKENPMLTYWVNRISYEENERNSICRFSIQEATGLLKWAILVRNENAVQYIFELYCKNYVYSWTYLSKLITYAFKCKTTARIISYLVSKIDRKDKFEFMLIKNGNEILKMIFEDLRFVNSFKLVAQYLLKFVTKMIFFDALNMIVFCWNAKVLDRPQFKTILTDFLKVFKLQIINCLLGNDEDYCYKLFSIEDEEYLKSLCRLLPVKKRRKRHCNKNVLIKKCTEWTQANRSDLVHLILKEFMIREEDIKKFKSYLEKTACPSHSWIEILECSFHSWIEILECSFHSWIEILAGSLHSWIEIHADSFHPWIKKFCRFISLLD